jgi:protoheme IX farnesyltransferase
MIMKERLRPYWDLIKSLQTGLLLATGMAGYMSARCPLFNLPTLLSASGSLYLAISGSTALNMWYDRDIDARMKRTFRRPLATGRISPAQAFWFGTVLTLTGMGWALALNPLFGLVVFWGWFLDVVVYTMVLKRRTAWSVVWGGLSGGMPVLAGRALGMGQIEGVGLLMTLAVLFWIPTHIMTFNIRNCEDYRGAGVPTFPSVYGIPFTRRTITLSSLLAAACMGLALFQLGMSYGCLALFATLSVGLLTLALASLVRPSEKVNFGLFKYASIYMLTTMLLVIIAAL